MAETIKNQWLINSNNEKIAPYTMLNQVLDSKTGNSLDILLDNLKNSNGQINFQNTYFLSQEMENKESEASALKRLLALNGFKVIIVDRNVTLDGSSLTILSNTFLIGAHKNIVIQNPVSNKPIFIFSLEDAILSNVYIANLFLRGNISFGSDNNRINCQNCKFENILVQNDYILKKSDCYANNLILNSVSFTQGNFTLIGEKLNLQNIQFISAQGIGLTFNNSLVNNIIISEISSYISIKGNNNIFSNIIFKNNTAAPTISGSNNNIQGQCLEQKANGKNIPEFYLSAESLNNIITMQLIPSSEDSRLYGIGVGEEINNQFYISSPEGTYNNGYHIFKDKWVFSDYENTIPLILDTAEYSLNEETQKIKELGNGQYLINGEFEQISLNFSNLVTRMLEGREGFYPISCKNITPLNNNNNIYIKCENSLVPDNNFQINLNEKYLNIPKNNYNISIYLNGTFNNEIFSFQQILSTSNNKVHIGG